jgi:hypothetical protein
MGLRHVQVHICVLKHMTMNVMNFKVGLHDKFNCTIVVVFAVAFISINLMIAVVD